MYGQESRYQFPVVIVQSGDESMNCLGMKRGKFIAWVGFEAEQFPSSPSPFSTLGMGFRQTQRSRDDAAVAESVIDGAPMVYLDALDNVGMMSYDDVGASIYHCSGEGYFIGGEFSRAVYDAFVQSNDKYF